MRRNLHLLTGGNCSSVAIRQYYCMSKIARLEIASLNKQNKLKGNHAIAIYIANTTKLVIVSYHKSTLHHCTTFYMENL